MIWRLIHDEINVITLNKIDGATSINTDLYQIYESMTINECLDKINELGLIYENNETIISLINTEVDDVKLTLDKNELITTHYDNIVSLISERISSNNLNLNYLETQTILAEDNNIELNYNGTHESALDGGITIINGVSENNNSYFKINSDGDFVTNVNLIPKGFVIPEYTPSTSSDSYGVIGNFTRDDNYLYIKGNNGWKRVNLENF